MKHQEFYYKYKARYAAFVNPIFSRKNWWRLALTVGVAVLIEPLLIYKYNKWVSFSFSYYMKTASYFAVFIVPFVLIMLWINWREEIKKSRGYGWIGKFEVVEKRSSLTAHYLLVAPGEHNELKVSRIFFDKIRVGDFIQVKRDALWNIEDVSKISSLAMRLSKFRSTSQQSN